MILLLLACAGGAVDAPPPSADRVSGPCAEHVAMPDVYGYCLTREARTTRDGAAMTGLCERAGAWEGECRQAWVIEQRRSGRETDADVLLAACGSDADCAFEHLDAAPQGDVLAQIDRCEAHVRPYYLDCTAHALTRWVRGGATAEEAERLRVRLAAFPETIGPYLARAGTCYGADVHCGDAPDLVSDRCRTAAARMEARSDLCRRP